MCSFDPQPIAFLPTFSTLLQEIVYNSQDQHDNLEKARLKPYLRRSLDRTSNKTLL